MQLPLTGILPNYVIFLLHIAFLHPIDGYSSSNSASSILAGPAVVSLLPTHHGLYATYGWADYNVSNEAILQAELYRVPVKEDKM